MALSDGAISVNPSPGLFTPACQPEKPRLVMSVSEIQRALDVLPLRERLMFRMAVFAGMRPGGILALLVANVGDGAVHVEQPGLQASSAVRGRSRSASDRATDLSAGVPIVLAASEMCVLTTSVQFESDSFAGLERTAKEVVRATSEDRSWHHLLPAAGTNNSPTLAAEY